MSKVIYISALSLSLSVAKKRAGRSANMRYIGHELLNVAKITFLEAYLTATIIL